MSNSSLILRLGKPRVRAPRVEIDLVVESKTIGTEAAYKLSTVDVSKSGLLLAWDRKGKVPFIVNTILEMTIDPGCGCLDKPVACLGKVVRRVDDSEIGRCIPENVQIGVQIVQMDNFDVNTWEGCLDELEKKYGVKPSNKIVGPAPTSENAA